MPANAVEEVAKRENATPFDISGAELGHHDGKCTFDAIIAKFGLKDAALLRLAEIVSASYTGRMDEEPLAFGFEAITVGYSIRFPYDLENIDRQFDVYDALYAWCRLDTARKKK